MNIIRRSMALLVFTVIGLGGCAHEWSSMSDPHPVTAADMQAVLRDEWSRHLFWIRNVVLDNAKSDLRSRDFAEKAVATNTRDMAKTFAPFYGDAVSERFRNLLTKHYGMIKAYSEATVAGNKRRQDAAIVEFASITDEMATFFSGINPPLSKETVRNLFATNVDHHVAQINKFQDKDYADEEETWPVMEHHVYVIADALTAALVKQFPTKFNWRFRV
ncbi:MAG: hypothetical protein OEV04_12850 [Nitrospira sp.]|nr:hypothetical protein [Nitrospira sp.]